MKIKMRLSANQISFVKNLSIILFRKPAIVYYGQIGDDKELKLDNYKKLRVFNKAKRMLKSIGITL